MKITFSTPVRSLSKSSNWLIEIPDFLCQFMPYNDAAMLDAAVVLAEYIEKLCSIEYLKKREKKQNKSIVKICLKNMKCGTNSPKTNILILLEFYQWIKSLIESN